MAKRKMPIDDAAEALELAAAGPADTLRCSGVDNLSQSELVTLRAWMSTLDDNARVRVVFPHGDSIIERPIDKLWEALGRRPTAGEYHALAKLCQEMKAYCLREAAEVAGDASKR